MIDVESLRKHIRFTVEHYGTKTQGESVRYDQVAAYLAELIVHLVDANEAVSPYNEGNIRFSLKVGL